jgi:hypothetical protein
VTSVTVDVLGNSYLTGWFNGSIVFNTDTLTSIVQNDIFIVKYDSVGNLIWAKSAGGTGNTAGLGITLDAGSNIYITGYFTSQFIFANDTLVAPSNASNVFLVKYDSSGSKLWGRSAKNTCGGSQGWSVATDGANNVYIAGLFGTTSCSIIFDQDTLSGVGYWNTFLAKYDSMGNVIWAKGTLCPGSAKSYFIATDGFANIYMTGNFDSTITFGASTLINSSGNSDGYLAKYDSSGNALWARSIGGSFLTGYCVATNQNDKIYIAGGSWNPTDTIVTFDTLTAFYPGGTSDPMFVAGYNSSGNILFAKILASGADDKNAISVSQFGSIYVGGDFLDLNPFIVGNDSLPLVGQENVFIAKLRYFPTLGISEESEFLNCNLFPNPFSNTLNVSMSGEEKSKIIIYDVLSRKILEQEFTSDITLNLEEFVNGVYIYEVKNKKGICKKGKVVKN